MEDVQPDEGPQQGVPLGSTKAAEETESEDQCPELVAQEEDDDSDEEMDEEEEEEEGEEVALRRNERIKQGVGKPTRYAAATVKLREGRHNAEEKNARIKAAKMAEIKQVFEDLKALEPVDRGEIPEVGSTKNIRVGWCRMETSKTLVCTQIGHRLRSVCTRYLRV
jgi:hypothetical protein